MSEYVFLFDLDSTITSEEILPRISREVGQEEEMRRLTEETMQGLLPFKQSFLSRIELLRDVPVSEVRRMICGIGINPEIARFMRENRDRCYIITGNLDVWIESLVERLGLTGHCLCSHAFAEGDRIQKVISVLDKEKEVSQFVQPTVVVGDGNNDAGMAELADIAVGFGGVRNIAPALLQNVDYAFLDDKPWADFLRRML